MAIKSCGITGLGSGLRVEGLGKDGSLVLVVFEVAFFAVAVFGFAFACAMGFALCAVAFFAGVVFFAVVGFAFALVAGFFATGFAFAIIVISFG